MATDQLYTIGQAAKICNTSVQTLRFYDKINLVKPGDIDPATGYRHYSNLNLLHIKIVQDMKQLQFSLEEIGQVIGSRSLDEIRTMMILKHEETLYKMNSLRQAADSLEQRISQLDFLKELGHGIPETDVLVELKYIPERRIASRRMHTGCGLEPSVIGFTELYQFIAEAGLQADGYIMTIYHEDLLTFDRDYVDLERCIPIRDEREVREENTARQQPEYLSTIPEGNYITALYCGIPNADSCKQIYQRLLTWMNLGDYEAAGPAIEQYLVDMSQMMKPEEFIVELQVPVRKRLTL
ncbi:MerR family transcriptional regulator [Paenibacillus sp. YPG26]|uniref:MerR family transcriptional regulator n=1 Tax=Paenibacillus sp. YPG26 TaxID=2878915 RepID=UPI00203AFB06|nr:MerR family transcriptional regulator [Paenibacillus sp. YPG26]USB31864.1 MerR family transcriptional regulator [Paenibacillus sp. YPG26]